MRRRASPARDLREGNVFAAHWAVDGLGYVRRVSTLEEATAIRDKAFANCVRPLPDDYYERQGRLQHVEAWLEHYDAGRWTRIKGSEMKGTGTFTCAD